MKVIEMIKICFDVVHSREQEKTKSRAKLNDAL